MSRPRMPRGLAPSQKRAWRELVREIERSQPPVTSSDGFLLEACAVALSRARRARTDADKGTFAPTTATGFGVNPALGAERQAWFAVDRLTRRLGIAPQLDPPGQERLFK